MLNQWPVMVRAFDSLLIRVEGAAELVGKRS